MQNDSAGARERTAAERQEAARKAGIKSGEARRKKAGERKCIRYLMSLRVDDTDVRAGMRSLGIDEARFTNEMLVSVALLRMVTEKNLEAIKYVNALLGNDPALILKEKELNLRVRESENARKNAAAAPTGIAAMLADLGKRGNG